MASITTRTDTFDSSLAGFWTSTPSGGSISVSGGQVVITSVGSESYINTPTSGDTWSSGDRIYAQIKALPAAGQANIAVNAEGHVYLWFYQQSTGNVIAYNVDTASSVYSATYNSTTHAYLGISRTASGVEFFSSTDGSSWTSRGTVTVSLSTGAVWSYLSQSNGAGTSEFDNFNTVGGGGGGAVGGTTYGTALRDAIVGAIEAQATTGVLKIYSNATAGLGTVLASITLPSDCFSAVSSSAITKNGTWSTTGLANGTPLSFCLFKSDGTTPLHQGSVSYTGGGGDLTIDNGSGASTIASGDSVTISTWTYTAPTGD